MKTTSVLRYLLIGSIALILIALGLWYLFIRTKQAEVAREDAGRGAGTAQSLASGVGSTYQNIISSVAATLTGKEPENTEKTARLSQVSATPTAGAGFVGSGVSERLRFVERSTGYLFETPLEKTALTRLTNTLVPQTYEALIAENGSMVMRRTPEEGGVETIAARIATSTPSRENLPPLEQKRLPFNIRSIVMSPSGEEIFYIAGSAEGAVGVKSTWSGTSQKQVLASALSGWKVYWPNTGRITMVEYPSDNVAGYAYEIGKDGVLSPLVRGVPGLTVLPHPTSSALLYGESSGELLLFARISNDSSAGKLPVRTIADKCVWSPVEKTVAYCAVPQTQPTEPFLDRWYRGEVHTSDAWWRVDASAVSAELLLSPKDSVDVENPIIDTEGSYIAFQNAADKSLWLLHIQEQ